MRRAVVALSLVLWSSCAKDLSELGEFACARDSTCPAGFACTKGKCRAFDGGSACETTSAGSPVLDPCRQALRGDFACLAGACARATVGTPCGDAASSSLCASPLTCSESSKTCTKYCKDSRDCAGGGTCAGNACVKNCASDAECAAGTACIDGPEGRACRGPGQGQYTSCSLKACAESGLSSFDLVCDASATCLFSSTGDCECPTGDVCFNRYKDKAYGGLCLLDCSSGQLCPTGTTCSTYGDVGLTRACVATSVQPGSACATDGQSCGFGLTCERGSCNAPCSLTGACGEGYACTAADSTGTCMPSCTGGTCPSGKACLVLGPGREVCVTTPPGLDTPCTGTCPGGLECRFGLCAPPCGAGGLCASGRVCSSASGVGVCLPDCTLTSVCPSGLGCSKVPSTGESACLPRGQSFPACVSVTRGAECRVCGKGFEVPSGVAVYCSSRSSYCPVNSSCGTTSGCVCNAGYHAETCFGLPCNSVDGGCAWPDWFCRQNTPESTCQTIPHSASDTCVCADGRQLLVVCGNSESCEKLCADGCSVAAQDCGSGEKCTLIPSDGGLAVGATETECRPAGTQSDGAPCSRSAPGEDDCVSGAYCTRLAPAGTLQCRKLCRSQSDCGSEKLCVNDGYFSVFPTSGLCLQACNLPASGASGLTCPFGMACSLVRSVDNRTAVTACRALGTASASAACASNNDCASGLDCVSGACRPHCSSTAPCAVGTCRPAGYVGNSTLGTCQ